MGLNHVIAKLAVDNANKWMSDTLLYDAIAERDTKAVVYLANNKYKLDIINAGFIQEPVRINQLVKIVESLLDTKHIVVA